MTVSEVFEKIDAHMKEGMIFHDKMADYYDFLGLMGFKRLHEYRFFEESAAMRGVNRYYINHFNRLIEESKMEPKSVIPASWYGPERREVGTSAKRSAIRSGMEAWMAWEKETKVLYERCYCCLCKLEEIAAACKVKELISDVDMELKEACRLNLKLQSIDYDMPTILLMQDEMHEHYREKEKGIGVDIC